MCASEAAVEGVAACELGTDVNHYEFVTYANAGDDGSVVADVVLRRLITTPFTGPVDCQSTAERCLVAIGAVSNYDRSGGSFIGFAGAPPFPTPTLALEPPGPYASGQEVTVLATGLLPTRHVEVLQCLDGACATLFAGTVAADGTFTTVVVLESALADAAGNVLPCADACLLQLTDSRLPGTTSAPLPMPVEQHRLVRALVVRATTSLTKRLPPGKGF